MSLSTEYVQFVKCLNAKLVTKVTVNVTLVLQGLSCSPILVLLNVHLEHIEMVITVSIVQMNVMFVTMEALVHNVLEVTFFMRVLASKIAQKEHS
jgi:hypothetical protein